MTEIKDRIFAILRATGRPGTEAVIDYLKTSNYFTRGCYSHHKERGGLARHSLEVYEHMLANAVGFSSDSIAVVALFHDLGKTLPRDGRGHGRRSVDILDRSGFELSRTERIAVAFHHDSTLESLSCALRRRLTAADCNSTGSWKRSHRKKHK